MHKALGAFLTAAQTVLPAEGVAIWLHDAATGQLTLAAAQGLAADEATAPGGLADQVAAQQALAEGIVRTADSVAPPARLYLRLGPQNRPLGVLHLRFPAPDALTPDLIRRATALADLAGVLLEMAQRAAEAERLEAAQAEFIHVTTHELRSPVAVSQSLIRNVLKGYAGAITDKQRHVFGRISAQLDHLESLVNDLLDLAASQARAAREPGPVALNGPVGRAVLLFQPRAEEKGITLEYHACRDEIVVMATEDGLDRILANLVGNAVKYTPPGGRVTVGLCQTGDEAIVTVADTGIGIPAEALPRLFEEFYRAPNARAANITGTGLGLAIVKRLVDLYRGTISVESTVGVGTTFTVTFPLHRA